MRYLLIITFLSFGVFSGGAFAQNTVEKCFSKPSTVFVESQDLNSETKLIKLLKKNAADLAKDEMLYLYVYSQGSWATNGLSSFASAAKVTAKLVLGSEKLFEVENGGYRTEASIDLFVLGKECREQAKGYERDPDTTVERVDFSNAPLGESVFPSGKEWPQLIAKSPVGGCDNSYSFYYVTFFIIVGKDGRVLFAVPKAISNYYSEQHKDYAERIREARQVLSNWVFNTPVIDGTPRHIRGQVTVGYGEGPCEIRKSIKPT